MLIHDLPISRRIRCLSSYVDITLFLLCIFIKFVSKIADKINSYHYNNDRNLFYRLFYDFVF